MDAESSDAPLETLQARIQQLRREFESIRAKNRKQMDELVDLRSRAVQAGESISESQENDLTEHLARIYRMHWSTDETDTSSTAEDGESVAVAEGSMSYSKTPPAQMEQTNREAELEAVDAISLLARPMPAQDIADSMLPNSATHTTTAIIFKPGEKQRLSHGSDIASQWRKSHMVEMNLPGLAELGQETDKYLRTILKNDKPASFIAIQKQRRLELRKTRKFPKSPEGTKGHKSLSQTHTDSFPDSFATEPPPDDGSMSDTQTNPYGNAASSNRHDHIADANPSEVSVMGNTSLMSGLEAIDDDNINFSSDPQEFLVHLPPMTSLHRSKKLFQCSKCGKKFSKRYNCMQHTRIHPGSAVLVSLDKEGEMSPLDSLNIISEQPREDYNSLGKVLFQIASEIPGSNNEASSVKTSDQSEKQRDELIPHTRRFECPVESCSNHPHSFMRKCDLRRHLRAQPKRDMICSFCPASVPTSEKTFSNANILLQHLEVVHETSSIILDAPRQGIGRDNETKSTSAEGHRPPKVTFKCEACSRTFDSSWELWYHFSTCKLYTDQLQGLFDIINSQRDADEKDHSEILKIAEKKKKEGVHQGIQATSNGIERDSCMVDMSNFGSNVSFMSMSHVDTHNIVQDSQEEGEGAESETRSRENPNKAPYSIDSNKLFALSQRLAKDDWLSFVEQLTPEDRYQFWTAGDVTEEQLKQLQQPFQTRAIGMGVANSGAIATVGDIVPEKSPELKALGTNEGGVLDDEIPYTDSGYASALNISDVLSKSKEAVSNTQGDKDEDARTTYSAATSVDPGNAQNYVSDLAHHIHYHVASDVDVESKLELGKQDLIKSLPELVKAFAVQIGLESTLQINRDIMYFVHKRHREIVTEVEKLLLHKDDDDLGAECRVGSDGMSLVDKMNLWRKNAEIDEPREKYDDLFDGVEDAEDETIKPEEALRYNKVILESSAYSWFIENLRKQCSLQHGPAEEGLAIDEIRQKLLRTLPSSKVSKRIAPQRQRCTFRISSAPLRAVLSGVQGGFQSRGTALKTISEVVVVTCSSDEAQATTVGDYFAQTWPSAGMVLCESLQQVLDCNGDFTCKGTLPDRTRILIQTQDQAIFISIHGLTYSIVECAEQLAWLVTALQEPHNNTIVSYKPSIMSVSIPTYLLDMDRDSKDIVLPSRTSAVRSVSLVQGFSVIVGEKIMASIEPNEEVSWHRLMRDRIAPVIVHGFPVARRPEPCPGLELSFALLLEVVGSTNITICNDSQFINGSRAHLKMVKKLQNTFYWQETNDMAELTSGVCHSLTDDNLQTKQANSIMVDFENGRHIICNAQSVLEEMKDRTDSISTEDMYMTDSALTDGVLSISSNSDDPSRQEQGSAGFDFFYRLFLRLVSKFRETAMGAEDGDGRRSNHDTQMPSNRHSAAPSLPGPSFERKRKRKAQGDCSDDEDDEGGNSRQPKRPKPQQPGCADKPKYLACPFWKLDPEKHRICLFKKLTSISYVKQHMVRRHTPTSYCAICFEVFDDFISCDNHVLQRTCQRNPTAKLEGISHEKNQQLRRKSKPGPAEDQWFAIWKILFPDHPRPLSAYVDLDLSEDFCLLREFSQRQGASILLEQLRDDGLRPRLDILEHELQETLRRGLDAMFERFQMNHPSASTTSIRDSRETSLEIPASERTSLESYADSGVVVTSNSSNSFQAVDMATFNQTHAGSFVSQTNVFEDGSEQLVNADSTLADGQLHTSRRNSLPGAAPSTQRTDGLARVLQNETMWSEYQNSQAEAPLQEEVHGIQRRDPGQSYGLFEAGSSDGTGDAEQLSMFDDIFANLLGTSES